jgi:D-3-phosphoglycerate dehydrogenase
MTARERASTIVAVLGTRWGNLEIERRVLEPPINLAVAADASPPALIAAARDAAAVLLGSQAVCSAEVIGALAACRVIVRYGVGTDNVDLEAARARQIPVANVPDYGVDEVATHALTLALACYRKLFLATELPRRGEWRAGPLRPIQAVNETTFGVVGLGRIGRTLAGKAAALGFRVLASDPYISADRVPRRIRLVPLNELLREADLVSLHMPVTPETQGLIGPAALARMKPSAYLINTARGELVDEAALAKALRANRLAGAALDVLRKEPPPPDHPLLSCRGVLVTPHVGWYSEAAEQRLRRSAAEEVRRALRGKPLRNPV